MEINNSEISKKINIRLIAVIAGILSLFAISGCSCGKKNDFVPEAEKSRTYESDSEDDKLRRKSLVDNEKFEKTYYSGLNIKGEKNKDLEKLEYDGKRALRNKSFVTAEKLFAEGDYEEAMKYYSSANSSSNEYIKRRALNCDLTIKKREAKNDDEIKKVYSLLVDKREDEALTLLNSLEKSSKADSNIYIKQRVAVMKSNIYDRKGDTSSAGEASINSQKISVELLKQQSNAWTTPIGRE